MFRHQLRISYVLNSYKYSVSRVSDERDRAGLECEGLKFKSQPSLHKIWRCSQIALFRDFSSVLLVAVLTSHPVSSMSSNTCFRSFVNLSTRDKYNRREVVGSFQSLVQQQKRNRGTYELILWNFSSKTFLRVTISWWSLCSFPVRSAPNGLRLRNLLLCNVLFTLRWKKGQY
jgi:hypothetical protein